MCIRDSVKLGWKTLNLSIGTVFQIVRLGIRVDVYKRQVINLSATLAQEMTVRAGIGIITCVTLVDSQGLCGNLLAQ